MAFWIAGACVKPHSKYDLSAVCPSTVLSPPEMFGIQNSGGNYLPEAHKQPCPQWLRLNQGKGRKVKLSLKILYLRQQTLENIP